MKKFSALLLLTLITPQFALALDPPKNIQEFGVYLMAFIDIFIIPFFFSLALLIFIYNVIRYFIFNHNNSDYQEKAKRYALYSVIGMVLMTVIWGITNLLVSGLGLARTLPVCPDYFTSEQCNDIQGDPTLGINVEPPVVIGDGPVDDISPPPEPGGYPPLPIEPTEPSDAPVINPFVDDLLPSFNGLSVFEPTAPIFSDSSLSLTAAEAAVETEIITETNAYITIGAEIDFGDNVNFIIPLLAGFNDSLRDSGNFSNQEDLTAAKRLETLDILTSTDVNNYETIINQVRADSGAPAIKVATIQISEPLPSAAQVAIAETRSSLRDALSLSLRNSTAQNSFAINNVTVTFNPNNGDTSDEQLAASLITDDLYTGTTEERVNKINNLLDSGFFPDQFINPQNAERDLWDQFIDDINMERLFQGLPPS